MKKVVICSILCICVGFESHAQSMTYNHDDSKQGQIQVMELGAGNLTPELYYTVLHRRYKNGAKAVTSVKNTLRIATNTASPVWSLSCSMMWKSLTRTVPLRKLASWLCKANCIFLLNSQIVFCLTPYSTACFEDDMSFFAIHISKTIWNAVRSGILILSNKVPAVGLSSYLHLVHRLAKGSCPLQ